MVFRSPIVSKKKMVEEARKILQKYGETPENGITEEQYNAMRDAGIIREEEGEEEAAVLNIRESECKKLPGATVIGKGEDKICLVRYYKRGGDVVVKELKIAED